MIFKEKEGDGWHFRNHLKQEVNSYFPELELISEYVKGYIQVAGLQEFRSLEVGCGYGRRTFELASLINGQVFGIDPSKSAITFAQDEAIRRGMSRQMHFEVATAEMLPFLEESLDLVFYGWCLCYVDRESISEVFTEAVRVLRRGGFMAVLDFDYPYFKANTYVHDDRIKVYKEDYSPLVKSMGFELVAKMALNDSGSLGFDIDPEKRIAMWLFKQMETVSRQEIDR